MSRGIERKAHTKTTIEAASKTLAGIACLASLSAVPYQSFPLCMVVPSQLDKHSSSNMKEAMTPALVEPVEIAWRLLQDANDTVGNETSSNDEDAVIYDDSQVLRDTFVVYGSIMVVIILLFCWARRRFPNVYNIRNWVEHLKSPLAADPHGFFSWIWKVYLVTEDELLDECGLDAVCFVRISQMGYKMAYVPGWRLGCGAVQNVSVEIIAHSSLLSTAVWACSMPSFS